jgi:hypothetical protein
MANIVGAGGTPDRALQALVSANFFTTLGVQPALGRGFQEGEDQPGREREVVLSDRLWRSRFAADPRIVGQNIRLDDQNFLVIGVAGDLHSGAARHEDRPHRGAAVRVRKAFSLARRGWHQTGMRFPAETQGRRDKRRENQNSTKGQDSFMPVPRRGAGETDC